MTEDDRKNIKVQPDVHKEFSQRQPPAMNQSEFVEQLLADAEFHERPTADEIRDIVREEVRRVLKDVLDSR